MGNFCCKRNKQKKKIALLLVGLDNAGKSVAVKGLAGESLNDVIPTVGLSVVYLKYKDCSVKIFDLGGGSNIRKIWQRYFVDVHGIIFVVDSSDYDRLGEVQKVLTDLLSHEKISGKPVLLLANKQDRQDALDELDLVEALRLERLVNKRKCPTLVETCSAATEVRSKSKIDPGIQRGYRWLLNYIIKDYEQVNARVERDVKEQGIREQEERLMKIERLKKLNDAVKKDDDIIESFSDYDRKLNGNTTNAQCNNRNDREDLFYVHAARVDDDDGSSSKSNESFPHPYYQTFEPEIRERPKSAVQLIKEQLELDCGKRKSPFVNLKSNRTAPISLLGVRHPRSATERKRRFGNERRAPKSAGDSALVTTNIPNYVAHEPETDGLHKQLFHLNNFQKTIKLPPLRAGSSNGDGRWTNGSLDRSGISLIEID